MAGAQVPAGHSTYHGLQTRIERRFADGLAILFAYTHSKLIDNVGVFITVHPSVPVNSVKEFIAYVKSKPRELSFGSSGPGSVSLLAGEMFLGMTGIEMTHIAYKGTGQALVELVGGHVQMFMMNPLVAIPHVKSGKLRGLGITSLERNIALPDMPTVAEQGYPGWEYTTWLGVLAPEKTPPPIITKLSSELARVARAHSNANVAISFECVSKLPSETKNTWRRAPSELRASMSFATCSNCCAMPLVCP